MLTLFLNMMDECCGRWWLHKTGTSAQCQVMVCASCSPSSLASPLAVGAGAGSSPWLWAAQ